MIPLLLLLAGVVLIAAFVVRHVLCARFLESEQKRLNGDKR